MLQAGYSYVFCLIHWLIENSLKIGNFLLKIIYYV